MALLATRTLRSYLFGVDAGDPMVLAAVAGLALRSRPATVRRAERRPSIRCLSFGANSGQGVHSRQTGRILSE